MPSISPFTAVTTAIVAGGIVELLRVGRRESDLPPGPPTKPVVGNLADFPLSEPHLRFAEWAKQYGEIFSLKMANGTIVVLNTPQAVRYVLDTKNAVTADRPNFFVINYVTGNLHLGFIKYGPTWRTLRKAATEILNVKACTQHLPIQYAESAQLLYDLLMEPEEHYTLCGRYSSSVVLSVVFGQRIPQPTSQLAKGLAHNCADLDYLVRPGNIPPIDLIPAFKYVPERWAKWKTFCNESKDRHRDYYSELVSGCESRIQSGKGNGCFIETLLERKEELGMTREMILYLGEALVEPGSDSTKTYLQNMILLLVSHPDVQKKAHDELDKVVGADRMPKLDDIKDLPYIKAVQDEVNRLRPFGPLGLPHCASEEFHYNNYRIPKDSTIFINVWAIYHDEDLFDEPNTFNPDRFVSNPLGVKDGVDPKEVANLKDLVFGAGRRVCPGMHLGKSSMILNTARILWAFDILKAKNADGSVIEPDFMDCHPTSSNAPAPFKCDIQPRSDKHKQIICREFLDAIGTTNLFEQELIDADKEYMRNARAKAERVVFG
ncbi:hypothetical protein FRC04_008992 [Tulasnella sp. 424]|nr:hypothetical protein FRC04_008992 [Tulasnella sp. 424]KAG8973650.1 hypothetical protein FRC05_008586 [Tulasnella sp. 425]